MKKLLMLAAVATMAGYSWASTDYTWTITISGIEKGYTLPSDLQAFLIGTDNIQYSLLKVGFFDPTTHELDTSRASDSSYGLSFLNGNYSVSDDPLATDKVTYQMTAKFTTDHNLTTRYGLDDSPYALTVKLQGSNGGQTLVQMTDVKWAYAQTFSATATYSPQPPTPGPTPTPEPTSAMLMLLGVAGLALKRKRV